MGEKKPATDEEAVPECALYLVGLGACADVEILGGSAHEQIADTAANKICGIAKRRKTIKHLQGVGINVLAGNAMIRPLVDDRFV